MRAGRPWIWEGGNEPFISCPKLLVRNLCSYKSKGNLLLSVVFYPLQIIVLSHLSETINKVFGGLMVSPESRGKLIVVILEFRFSFVSTSSKLEWMNWERELSGFCQCWVPLNVDKNRIAGLSHKSTASNIKMMATTMHWSIYQYNIPTILRKVRHGYSQLCVLLEASSQPHLFSYSYNDE